MEILSLASRFEPSGLKGGIKRKEISLYCSVFVSLDEVLLEHYKGELSEIWEEKKPKPYHRVFITVLEVKTFVECCGYLSNND